MLPIVTNNHPALRQKAEPIRPEKPLGAEVKTLIKKMRKTLNRTTGVGLAAPQVGVSLALFIVDYPSLQGEPLVIVDGKTAVAKTLRGMAVLNPQLTPRGEIQVAEEGCLSLPEAGALPVPRAYSVTMAYQDENLDSHTMIAQGFFARILQHENDHLLGKLITDYQKSPKTLIS